MDKTTRIRNFTRFVTLAALASGATTACGEVDTPTNDTTVEEINGGSSASGHRQAGRLDFAAAIPIPGAPGQSLGYCTATLVSPRMVLTARHCMPAGERGPLSGVTFVTEPSNAGPADLPFIQRAAVRFEALSAERRPALRADDLALVELDRPVPPRLLVPYVVSRRDPDIRENVTLVGFGVNNARPELRATRQQFRLAWWPTFGLGNHGDSGGPYLRDSGELFRVVSGADETGADMQGNPVARFADLQRVTRERETSPDAQYFADVPPTHNFYREIQLVYGAAITLGCSQSGNDVRYCPDDPITKAQLAAFVGRATHPVNYAPPPATGRVFTDVPARGLEFAAAWIEQLAAEGLVTGVVGGDGQRRYEPNNAVTRAVMTVYLVRVRHGGGFVPPRVGASSFADVPTDAWYSPWIEQAFRDGVARGAVGGDGLRRFVPDRTLTRGEMAAFIARLFDLPFRRFAF